MEPILVEALSDKTVDSLRHGGKGAALGRLISHGHNVPPGFVITSNAIDETLDALGLRADTTALAASLRAGVPDLAAAQRIHDGLLTGPLSRKLTDAIRSAVDTLNRGPLIIRSSATVEDSESHSFAGIFESIQVDQASEVEHALRAVWGSVYSPRALSYASVTDVEDVPLMAVIVQEFIDASRSGVMFTTFTGPQGHPATLVEHVEGTAEKLVLGEVTPARLWLDGTTDEPISAERLDGLSSSIAAALAELATTLEAQFDGPQDVEWCVLEDELYVVQTRPVTVGAGTGTSSITDVEPLLRGTAASGGVGTGAAHVAYNIEQALELTPGSVLVTTMTNPDMVVAMRNSAGIVTDVGGMICHAAIVSRELQLPCVVGTGSATEVLDSGQIVTVDGHAGAVYAGEVSAESPRKEPAKPEDVWIAWTGRAADGTTPLVQSLEVLRAAPRSIGEVVFLVDHEIRCDERGLWCGGDSDFLAERMDELLRDVATTTTASVTVTTRDEVLRPLLDEAVTRAARPGLTIANGNVASAHPAAAAAATETTVRRQLVPIADAIGRAMDPSNGPGPAPQVKMGPMPDPTARSAWWVVLTEYARYHHEFATAEEDGHYPWIEIRPEVIITPLLKSLVQPAFEMVPRVMGFAGMPPMHTQWFRGRFCVRADTFAQTWAALVDATWDPRFMPRFLTRVRRSYDHLAEVVELFPRTPDGFASLDPVHLRGLLTAWWPRWIEFFALTLFIQAQGEAILFPVIEETVSANLGDAADAPDGRSWPQVPDLVAPTTPVMSGEYMDSLERVRGALDDAGLSSLDEAMRALAGSDDLAEVVSGHISRWHWMRDRDLVFEPWDTPEHVIGTALRTEPHPPVDYAGNRRRNLFALDFHTGMAAESGRDDALHHAVRFLQDLNVERENHHILWLKHSYPLRQLIVEVERRLAESGDVSPGAVFFLQAPELLELIDRLPTRLPEELRARADQRRRAYRHEARLEETDPAELVFEPDYF